MEKTAGKRPLPLITVAPSARLIERPCASVRVRIVGGVHVSVVCMCRMVLFRFECATEMKWVFFLVRLRMRLGVV